MSKQNRAQKWLQQGLELHRAGHIEAAEQAFIEASRLDPRNPDALNLRGVVALARQREAEATHFFRKATMLQPENPGFWANLGFAAFATQNYAESEQAYRRALKLVPGNPDFGIGAANALAAAGQPDAATALLLDLAARRPGHAGTWFSLARIAEKAGKPEQALTWYQSAVDADPRFGIAHQNMGVLLQSMLRLEEAEQCYRKALDSGAEREQSLINLASILCVNGKVDEAERIACAGVAEFPGSSELQRTLAGIRVQRGDLKAALPPAKQALAMDPETPELQLTVGGLLFETGHAREGLDLLDQARRTHPDDQNIAFVAGVAQLTAGRWAEGWQGYTHREVRRAKATRRPWLTDVLPKALQGRSVGLLREQGLGDELFFLRFVPALKQLGAQVIYQTSPRMMTMLERVHSIDQLLPDKPAEEGEAPEPRPPFDFNLLLGDLPHTLYRNGALRPDEAQPPLPLELHPQPARVAALRERLLQLGPQPYLALTWRAGVAPNEQKGKWWTLFKTIDIDAFGRMLTDVPFTLISVQRKPAPGEITRLAEAAGATIHDWGPVNDDLEDMLALMAVVDEYVGVSNTNMHLRAGLQRTAQVLVPRPSEWRWMAYGNVSPWFPGFGIHRQDLDGSWLSALANVRTYLAGSH